MKPVVFTAIFFIASSFIFAQAAGNETDISEMVKKQIEGVKAKEQTDKASLVSQENASPASQNVEAGINSTEPKEMYFKIFLIIDACFIAALIVMWRRRKAKTAAAEEPPIPAENPAPVASKEILEAERKANEIKEQLEQVKLTGKKSDELKKIRKSLQTDPMFLNMTGEAVGKKAKQLSISKGEIYLAARIKSKEMAGECLEN